MPNKAEKIKWVLRNYGRAKARAKNLKVAAQNIEYIKAKNSVGGGGDGSRTPSVQEKYVDNKEDMEEEAGCLARNVEAIEKNINSLPIKQRVIIEAKYFDNLTDPEAAKELNPTVSERTVRNLKQEAIDNLKDWYMHRIYKPLENLLEGNKFEDQDLL